MSTHTTKLTAIRTIITELTETRERVFKLACWAKAGSPLRELADTHYTACHAHTSEWAEIERRFEDGADVDLEAEAGIRLGGATTTWQVAMAILATVNAYQATYGRTQEGR